MIVLRSGELLARIDPGHGGEILDLVELGTGRQLLGRPPFGSEPPLGGDLDEERWTASYRGGWQTVLPNAGAECHASNGHHGFHGRASADPWQVAEADEQHALLTWEGHGLEVAKTISVEGDALWIRYRITSAEGAPIVALEHVTVGVELLEPTVEINLPEAPAYELNETGGPLAPPDDAARWPDVRLADGSSARFDTWPIREPTSRFYVLADLPGGWAAIRNPARGQGLALAWDASWFRHCWVWHENRVWDDPWQKRTELLAIEPSTVPHPLGLAEAERAGQASTIAPGQVVRPWIVARPFVSREPVTGVDEHGRLR